MGLFLASFLLSVAFAAEEPAPSYTDTNSVQALRTLEKITERSSKGLPDEELVEWVRARFARIALLRLEGRADEALAVFAGCAKVCERHGSSEEWKALKAWGCGKKKGAAPCGK
jgi:hypothetical protein